MHLENEEVVARHCLQIGIEAVDHHKADIILLDRIADSAGKFARRQFGRIDLPDLQKPVVDEGLQIHVQGLGPDQQCCKPFVEQEVGSLLAAPHRGDHATHGRRGLACARRPGQQGICSWKQPLAKQRIQFGNAGRHGFARKAAMMIGRNQPGINTDPAPLDLKIVIASVILEPAHLDHPQPAPL